MAGELVARPSTEVGAAETCNSPAKRLARLSHCSFSSIIDSQTNLQLNVNCFGKKDHQNSLQSSRCSQMDIQLTFQ
jgi:hypothetical protein